MKLKDSEVHQVLKSIDTNLNYIRVHTPTLEEAYLEIIGANNKQEEAMHAGN